MVLPFISECNISIAAVKEYFASSVKDMEKKGNLTICLASDERDEEYRQTIMDLVMAMVML